MKLTCVTATFNVIAAGNRERLIRCVESVAKIPVEHEHLIYDGASTDGTAELLRELEKTTPGLKVVSEPDMGIYNALNKGVRDAKGEWFYVLGCDDYIYDGAVMVAAMINVMDAEFVMSPVLFSGAKRGLRSWSAKVFFCGPACPHQGALMKTETIRQANGFDERYRIIADVDLMQRLIFSGTKTAIFRRPYAVFGLSGVSADEDKVTSEYRQLCTRRFNLTAAAAQLSYPKRLLPVRRMAGLLLSRNRLVRRAAAYQIARCAIAAFNLLDKNGHLRGRA